MKLAHLSDPHILNLDGVGAARLLLTKRFTGWANIKLNRGSHHRRQVVEAMMDDIRTQQVDHVAVTGDLTNLALDPEFDLARRVLDRMGLDAARVSIIPGNHDVYTQGSQREQRFVRFFGPHITCDLDLATPTDHPSGPFPFVRLRGPLAIIGVSTAVARFPLVASGHAGQRQIDLVARALCHPALSGRTPVILMHHPLVNPAGWLATIARGMAEAAAFRAVLGTQPVSMVLHGHLHHRLRRTLVTAGGGTIHHVGATSASLVHRHPDRMAGYNLYEFTEGGVLAGITARVWDPDRECFITGTVSEAA